MPNQYNFNDIAAVDKQIATLLECKPLPESEVRQLSEKVTNFARYNLPNRLRKS